MAVRFYLVPEDRRTPDEREPKYVYTDELLAGIQWSGMDYGIRPVFFLAVYDPTSAQHTELNGKPDVFAIPPGGVANTNLDQAVGSAALTLTRTAMELLFIPAGWVTAATTWRQVLAASLRMCQFMQRLHGMYNLDLGLQVSMSLNVTLGSLPAELRTQLADVVDSFGWDRSGITGSWTLRQFLKWVGEQFTAPVYFGGMTF